MARLGCCVWLVLALSAACDPSERTCHFGAEHAVFASASRSFDDVALVWQGDRAVALFSEKSGLYARELDRHGLPVQRATRLGERCEAGLAAADGGKASWLACARRDAAAADGDTGAVTLYALDRALPVAAWTDLASTASFGPVGPNSHGVALAPRGDAIALAWQDATVGDARVWLAHWSRGAGSPAASVLSDADWYAGTPALVPRGDKLLAVWAESREVSRAYESRVRFNDLAAQSGAPAGITVVSGRDPSPSPELVASPAGMWLAFRDRRKAARKTGLYLARLGPDGKPIGELVRAGRADGVGRPVLRACLGGLVAATPRTFAGDYFIGVVHADESLRSLSGEQQFYEDSHEFAQVAVTCLGDSALLLIAERGRLGKSQAALRSVSFSCN